MTEKSCNLLEQWIDLPQEKGSGTSWASSDEHLPKLYLSKRLKLATFQQWARRGSREVASEGLTILHIHFCSLGNC